MKKFQITKMKMLVAAGVILLVGGIAGAAPTLYFRWTSNGTVAAHGLPAPTPVAAQPASALTKPVIGGQPVEISIPSLHKNLQVIDGYYNSKNKQWTLTLDKAQYATPSVQPNDSAGTTLIYGHYRPEVFAYLHLIKPGAQVYITTDNGYKFSYTYTDSYATSPTDMSVFNSQGAPRLVIQTCSGTFFQNRQMYLFTFDSVEKI